MWSWAFSCFKMLNTSSPSGSWSNCNSITCTRRNYSAMLFTIKIKYQIITLPHLLCLEEGFQWRSPCLRLFEPSVRSAVVQWERGWHYSKPWAPILGQYWMRIGQSSSSTLQHPADAPALSAILGQRLFASYLFKPCACTFFMGILPWGF